MDTDTLIYIFFIVVSIIASISRGSRKKKNKKPVIPEILTDKFPSFEEEKPYDPFEEIRQRPPMNIHQDEEIPVDQTSGYDDLNNDEITNYDEELIEEIEQKEKTPESSPPLHHAEVEETEETEFDFDPVKAIIYSEILKRPEY